MKVPERNVSYTKGCTNDLFIPLSSRKGCNKDGWVKLNYTNLGSD